MAGLRFLDVGSNELTGDVPDDIGRLSGLESLRLSRNRLSGMLPRSLTQLYRLQALHFDHNDGLCAPADSGFQLWLDWVPDKVGDLCRSDRDRLALMALYNATDGPNWTNNTNWLTDEPLTVWHGVVTDAGGRVIELHLTYNRLKGRLPTELGGLSTGISHIGSLQAQWAAQTRW